jgi:hypothetical protein
VSLALHQQRWRGVGLFRLAAAHVHADIGAAERIEELQATVVDAQPFELRACPPALSPRKSQLPGSPLRGAVSSSTSGRVRRTSGSCTLPRSRGQTRTSISTRSAWPCRLLRPAGIGEGDRIGADRAGAAEVDIQVADVQHAAGACLHRALDRPLNQFQSHNAISTRIAPAGRPGS